MGISSIWDNSFYNVAPQPKWLFEVDFESFFSNTDGYDQTDANRMSMAVTNCKWGQREVSVVKTYFAGVEANFPGRVMNAGELSFKFNENSSLGVSQMLEREYGKMISSQEYFRNDDRSYSENSFSKIDKIIKVKILKPNENLAINDNVAEYSAEIEFHNCWIKSIEGEDMSYDETDEAVTRTAVFSYDYMLFKKNYNRAAVSERNKPATLKI